MLNNLNTGDDNSIKNYQETTAPADAMKAAPVIPESGSSKLTMEQLMGNEIYEKVSELGDEIALNNYCQKLAVEAKALGQKRFFEEKMKPYKRKQLEAIKAKAIKEIEEAAADPMAAKLAKFPFITSEYDTRARKYRYKVSCPALAKYFKENNDYFFLKIPYDEKYYVYLYKIGVYTNVNDAYLKSIIKGYIESFDSSILRMADVNETLQIIKADDRFISEDKLNSYEKSINFRNGIYKIHDHVLIPHTPKLLSTIQIDCNFDPTKTECPTFDEYLDTLTGGDDDVKTLILEYMAVCISNISGKHMKQALIMYGPGDTGKSQLLLLTQRLLGHENFSVCNLKQLEARFGKSNLYHKRLCGSGEMSFVTVEELEVFKSATGGDQLNMEFKGQNTFPYFFRGLLWFCANALPRFGGDRGAWVYDRMLPVECSNVIPENKRDPHFIDKLYAERDAIVQKLIPYLDKVIANGYKFDQPESVRRARLIYRVDNSPVLSFLVACTEKCAPLEAVVMKLTTGKTYEVFSAWYKDNIKNSGIPSHQKFKAELEDYFNRPISDVEYRTAAGRYYPFKLNEEAYAKYGYLLGLH
ncbi:phage/plasmid primase, P4 family, C-terminal domain-containing protein [Ruminococcaceae bacterium FB2012]|nr:phage/plasmid primase, P4 family, C-terminal domain-containing protein [Ruminococcaceae bacterium FB2012]